MWPGTIGVQACACLCGEGACMACCAGQDGRAAEAGAACAAAGVRPTAAPEGAAMRSWGRRPSPNLMARNEPNPRTWAAPQLSRIETEKLVMALVEAELGTRRAAGAYSGKLPAWRTTLATRAAARCRPTLTPRAAALPTSLLCVQHSSIACRPCCQASCCPHASGRGGASVPVNAGHPAACLQTPG